MHSLSDQEILIRYRETNNKEYIGVLFDRYAHLVLGVCFKYLKNEEDAKDSLQQIFLKAIHDLHKHHVQHFRAWLYEVAKNHCLMQLRHRGGKKMQSLDEKWTTEILMPETLAHQVEKELLLDRVLNALYQLNDEQQICLHLFYLKKKSYQEIAAITGYSVLQVKSYIQNGKRNIRLMVEKQQPKKKSKQ